MALNAPAGAYTANRLFNTKLRPKGAAKSAFVPTEEETPQYRPAINPHSRKVSSSLISLEDRQFDEQHKRQVRLSQLAQVVESERKANETFAPRTNRTPGYINMDSRVPLSERAAPNRNLEQPLDPEATHKPKINSENDVNKEQVALNSAVRKRVRELWSQHAEGSTMSVSGILAALSDLGVKEPGDDATDEALDRYDAVVDKFLAAMGVDESVEDLRYAQYDRFCKVLSTIAKSALNHDRSQPATAAPVRVQNATATARIEQLRHNPPAASTATSSTPRAASAVKIAPKMSTFKKFSNKQFDVEDEESDEEMIAPQRGGPRQSPQPAMTPRQHPPQKALSNSQPSVSPRGRSGSEAGGPSASLDYFRSPSAQRSNQNARGHFGGMSPSLSPSPALDSVEIHSPSPLNPVSTRRPAASSQQHHHRDPLAETLVPQQQQKAPSPRPQSQSGRSTSRSQPGGGNVPVPQRLGAANKTAQSRPSSSNPRSQSSEGNGRPPSRSSQPRSATDQNASIQRLYSGGGPNSSLLVQEEYSFKPAINPHSNEVERKRAELGGLLRSRMSNKTLERQQRIAREMKEKEVSGCTFAPETVTRRPPTIYKFKDSPARGQSQGGEDAMADEDSSHPSGLPADPPGFDKAIQRMAEGRKRAVPKFEELLRSSIAVTTNSSSRPSTATRTRSAKASTNPSEIDEAEDNVTDTETAPSVTETKPFNLHSQHRVQERKEHRLLLFVDVDLPNGKTGRIGVHRGDDPETLSHNFCVTYSLDSEMKANLCTMLTEKIEVTLRAEEVRKAFSK